ncbi:MAG: enoyl-CoA hydratase-related protein [Halobacteria archaeon]
MQFENILIEKEEGIAILKINRPEKLNSLNSKALQELEAALDLIERDSESKVVILTGSGERAFIAGADIAEMKDKNEIEARKFAELGHRITAKLEAMGKPVIAAVNGYALGGGCEIAIACDIIIASENAIFGQPEVSLGICPGWGATQRLARWIGIGKAKELIYTGNRIDAREAERIGLVNKVVPLEKLMQVAREIGNKIASNAPLAVKYAKEAINEGVYKSITSGFKLEVELFGKCFAAEDQKEGMLAYLQRRKAQFKGR